VAISTLPLVLGNGEILAPQELDRLRGIAFVIDEKLRKCLPRERVRDNAKVAEALRFLVDDWMIDVKCSFTDKCNAITLALTIIERSLLAERPIGFITSPTPESGKTTLAKMLITAVTGTDAVAFAWSPHEEERRKAFDFIVGGHLGQPRCILCRRVDNRPRVVARCCALLALLFFLLLGLYLARCLEHALDGASSDVGLARRGLD
jgi:hypothetical protein